MFLVGLESIRTQQEPTQPCGSANRGLQGTKAYIHREEWEDSLQVRHSPAHNVIHFNKLPSRAGRNPASSSEEGGTLNCLDHATNGWRFSEQSGVKTEHILPALCEHHQQPLLRFPQPVRWSLSFITSELGSEVDCSEIALPNSSLGRTFILKLAEG